MKTRTYICDPPDDGREWILIDDAAKLAGVSTDTLRTHARKQNWTRTARHGVKAWLLKRDFDQYLWFVKTREHWYKKRRPKHWQPMVSIEPKETEADFPRFWWTTAQAADFMGVRTSTIRYWTKQGKIPVFTTRKMGRGGKFWYAPTSLRNLKASEEWHKGRAIWEKIKASMQQGTVGREAYTARHKPQKYRGVPPGWITVREVAERLQISIPAAHRLRRKKRFMSEQFVGDWQTKNRPWFCDEDGVERLKNDPEYQKTRLRGLNSIRHAVIGKPTPDTNSSTKETKQEEDHMMPEKLTLGYTSEELELPRLSVIGVNEMW